MRCPIVTDVFATDASPYGGAFVRAPGHVSRAVAKEMWLRAERKGGYTRLEDRSRTMLMQLGLAPETYDFAAELCASFERPRAQ